MQHELIALPAVTAREMTQAGLVEWRYGRVTVLDRPGLRAIAEQGINAGA